MIKNSIETHGHEEMIDITSQVQEAVSLSRITSGLCTVFIPHTTAGVTINENADPSVKEDILMALNRAVPGNLPYRHGEGNSPSHVKASLLGSSVSILIREGGLVLGTWQGIFFCEFDGPRQRRFFVNIQSCGPAESR
jgi:secondary thiamine-phosphate synthase enzyme